MIKTVPLAALLAAALALTACGRRADIEDLKPVTDEPAAEQAAPAAAQ